MQLVYFAMLSPSEAAQRLGISYATIKKWLYRGKLKAVRTPGGHYRIPEAELDSFLHQAKRPETPKREMLRTVSGRNQLTGRTISAQLILKPKKDDGVVVGGCLLGHHRRSHQSGVECS